MRTISNQMKIPGAAGSLEALSLENESSIEIADQSKASHQSNFSISERFGGGAMQTKLAVGSPDDAYESEAERVADTVMRSDSEGGGETKGAAASITPGVQLAATSGAGAGGGGTLDGATEQSIQAGRGGGQPLGDGVRGKMERGFGADFSGVRVHTDGRASELNQSLESRAFTTGQDIFFRGGDYSPDNASGQRLLAHELTHVVQQGGSGGGAQRSSAPVVQGFGGFFKRLFNRKGNTAPKTQTEEPKLGPKAPTKEQKAKALMERIEGLVHTANEATLKKLREDRELLAEMEAVLSQEQYDRAHKMLQPGGYQAMMGFRSAPAPKGKVTLPSEEEDDDMLGILNLDFQQEEEPEKDPELASKHQGKKGLIKKGVNWAKVSPLGKIGRGNYHFTSGDVTVTIVSERNKTFKKGFIAQTGSERIWVAKNRITVLGEAGFEKTDAPLFPLDDSGQQRKPSPSDVVQGRLGDCYLEAAMASLAATNPDFIFNMMRDHGDTVAVRLNKVRNSSSSNPTFTPMYFSVNKSVAKDELGEDLYNKGALWVTMLEKAYAAGGFAGTEADTNTEAPTKSFDKIAGGSANYALSVLTGTKGMYKSISSGVFQNRGLKNSRDLPFSDREYDIWEGLGHGDPYDPLNTHRNVFAGDKAKTDAWFEWCRNHGDKLIDVYKKKAGAYVEEIRLEDFEKIMDDNGLAGNLKPEMMAYLAKLYPGKRGTGIYTETQEQTFKDIKKMLADGRFVTVSTKDVVGRNTEGSGESGGEQKAKGLAGKHAYTVLEVKPKVEPVGSDVVLRYVKIRNPWGKYQREYENDTHKAKGVDEGTGESWIELSDLTKRFYAIKAGGF